MLSRSARRTIALAQFVVALGTVAPAANGPFASHGPVALVKVTGAIVRGHYLRKSATTLAVEDTGTSEASATPPPTGSVGVAMAASAGPGTATIPVYMLGNTIAGAGSGYNARIYRSTVQGIPTGVSTAISFDSIRYNNGPLWAIGTPTRMTAPVTGRYLIGGGVLMTGVPADHVVLSVRLNGTTFIARQDDTSNAASVSKGPNVNTIYRLNATDYVELLIFHDAASSQNVAASGNTSPEFWMEFLGA